MKSVLKVQFHGKELMSVNQVHSPSTTIIYIYSYVLHENLVSDCINYYLIPALDAIFVWDVYAKDRCILCTCMFCSLGRKDWHSHHKIHIHPFFHHYQMILYVNIVLITMLSHNVIILLIMKLPSSFGPPPSPFTDRFIKLSSLKLQSHMGQLGCKLCCLYDSACNFCGMPVNVSISVNKSWQRDCLLEFRTTLNSFDIRLFISLHK